MDHRLTVKLHHERSKKYKTITLGFVFRHAIKKESLKNIVICDTNLKFLESA